MLMVALTAGQTALLFATPSAAVVAIGVWWNSNTISHSFIHRPFFRASWANAAFALWLSVLLGYPQSLWRDRHLAHHAGTAPVIRFTMAFVAQVTAILTAWVVIGVIDPAFLMWRLLPGWVCGLALCAIHGHYEHVRGVISHYSGLYNTLCFNDGFHAEHHAWPGLHWSRLAERRAQAESSVWPAPLRWVESLMPAILASMESGAMRIPMLERWVLSTHRDALQRVLTRVPEPRHIAIVGGGLFPRTALILRELLPETRLTILDANNKHLQIAQARVDGVGFVHQRYCGRPDNTYDAIVIPLSYLGEREAIYADPPAPTVIVHDWLWRPRGVTTLVSLALFKRINLISRCR